ncbi:ABC transporter ATP-binding protein [Geovibrio thiophilus]|uniref:ABC transporter ATP-binding protein n=2 Tax=Geovibrio thiophilus TaxID=139438 RepID=A0A410K1Z5_9BACT|nr:ABC transporter ATP-binding protein [Geovibrio thiophilus]QAR34258.1 ABC transporter ATP-binding protein [Geovibrio thiophilus]
MSLLEIIDLNKSFLKGDYRLNVLSGFSMNVEKGEMLAIVGPSGAGKSTLLHIIGGLDKPDSGSVMFQGEDILKLKGKAVDQFRNKDVGFVFQFHYLLEDFTALENVMMPALIGGVNIDAAAKRAKELLTKVGLESRTTHFPAELSGGEQQRTAIARAMMNSPKILLADEPTGSLDKKNSDEVLDMIRLMRDEGVTILIVTHEDAIANSCDRIIRIEKS